MTSHSESLSTCYLCEETLAGNDPAAHFEARHGPRLLIPTGSQAAGGATVRALFRRSRDWPSLAADVLVLLHHGATACGSATEGIQGDAPVAACLQEIDDAVASLALARQVLTNAVLSAGEPFLGQVETQRIADEPQPPPSDGYDERHARSATLDA